MRNLIDALFNDSVLGPPTEVKRIKSFPCEVQLLTIRPLSESTRLLTLFKHPTLCEGGVKPTECGRELTVRLFPSVPFIETIMSDVFAFAPNFDGSLDSSTVRSVRHPPHRLSSARLFLRSSNQGFRIFEPHCGLI